MLKAPFVWKCLKAIARPLAVALFDLKVYGRRNIPRRGGVLIVSNHQGNLDPVLLGVAMDRPLNYIAKSELFEKPWSDQLLRMLNAFPVRQGAGDVGAIRETLHRLRQGHVLNIYPEGARTEDGEIAALQKGVAAIVRRCDVPVIPAVIVGSFEAWPVHERLPRSWPVRIRYGPPLRLNGLSPNEILETIDRTLRSMFDQLRQENGVCRRTLRRRCADRAAHLHQPPEVRGEGGED